jgi:hypothetical protein
MQRSRKPVLSAFASLGLALAAIGTGPHATCAQDASTASGPQFFVTPYLWLPSIHATTQTPLPRQPEVNSDISFIDLLSHLDGVPFMGSAEIRD